MSTQLPDLREQMATEEFWRHRDQEHRRRARRTVVLSIICAGFIALFIGRAVEVSVLNEQRVNSVVNCEKTQVDRRIFANLYGHAADQILGNPAKHVKPLKLKGTAFEPFIPLMRQQAVTQRALSKSFAARIENCKRVFPKRKTFWIF